MPPSRPHRPEESAQYRLTRVQVYNWGTFRGCHDLPVPRGGLLLTGQSGSGKSSLLDALSTVLVAPKDVRYNVAAQDASASDRSRTVLSYVRGAYKRTTDDVTGELRTAYLREGATFSGVALTYTTARNGDALTLARLFHVKAGAMASQDVRSTNLVVTGQIDLTELMPYTRAGIDKRALKRDLAERATVHDSYPAFAARFRRRLGLGNEVAQRLLHKTQSAKNLTSLDVLLRDFMLDEPRTFADADAAVDQFSELRAAHESVVETRHQQDVLLPLRAARASIEAASQEQEHASDLLVAVAPFVIRFKEAAFREQAEAARRRLTGLDEEITAAKAAQASTAEEVNEARRACEGLGDGDLRLIEERLATAQRDEARLRAAVQRLQEPLSVLGSKLPASRSELDELLATALAEVSDLERRATSRMEGIAALTRQRQDIDAQTEALRKRAEQVTRSRSAMGSALLDARELIASSIGVSASALPFVGEVLTLVEGSERWRVAAEALAGGFARTLVVPDHLYRQVACAVDAHRLRASLTYERVLQPGRPAVSVPSDALARHLRARPGTPVTEWLDAEITHRFPHHCVEDADALAQVERGVTLAGQVKGSATRHRKDDRRDLADPANWSIGVDPEELVAQLVREHSRLQAQRAAVTAHLDEAHTAARSDQRRREACAMLRGTLWEQIDVAAAEAQVAEAKERRRRAEEARPDLAQAKERLRQATARAEEAQAHLLALSLEQGSTRRELADLDKRITALADDSRLRQPASEGAPAVEAELEGRARTLRRRLDVDTIDAVARDITEALTAERSAAARRQAVAEGAARSVMVRFNERWSAQAAGLQPELAYMEDYLRALDTLQVDDLPRHEQRFATLLQTQTSQNVGRLAAEIRGAVREVRTRIAPVNEALRTVEYAPGHHLWIEVSERRPVVVEEFLATLSRISAGSLEPEARTAEEAETRFALLDEVMTRLGSSDPAAVTWRRQCLDTRRHVAFRAVEKDDAGRAVDYYEGASGLSGGQRQKLVIFCLAAALRYQLTAGGEKVPTYALVVLDEAFDKTDAEFTRAGLAVFRDFGFQLLLATPMTKIQVLEEYVGGAALVTNTATGDESRVHCLAYEVPEVREEGDDVAQADAGGDGSGDGVEGAVEPDGVEAGSSLTPDGRLW